MAQRIALSLLLLFSFAFMPTASAATKAPLWPKRRSQKTLPATSYRASDLETKLVVDGIEHSVPLEMNPWALAFHHLPAAEMKSLKGMNGRFGPTLFNDQNGYMGYGFYVAGNDISSSQYGAETVILTFAKGTRYYDLESFQGSAFFKLWVDSRPEFQGAVTEERYMAFAETFAIDVLFYSRKRQWMVVKNKKAIDEILIGNDGAIEWARTAIESDDLHAKTAAFSILARLAPQEVTKAHTDWAWKNLFRPSTEAARIPLTQDLLNTFVERMNEKDASEALVYRFYSCLIEWEILDHMKIVSFINRFPDEAFDLAHSPAGMVSIMLTDGHFLTVKAFQVFHWSDAIIKDEGQTDARRYLAQKLKNHVNHRASALDDLEWIYAHLGGTLENFSILWESCNGEGIAVSCDDGKVTLRFQKSTALQWATELLNGTDASDEEKVAARRIIETMASR